MTKACGKGGKGDVEGKVKGFALCTICLQNKIMLYHTTLSVFLLVLDNILINIKTHTENILHNKED